MSASDEYAELYKMFPEKGDYIHHYIKFDKLLRGVPSARSDRRKQASKGDHAYILYYNMSDNMIAIWHSLYGEEGTNAILHKVRRLQMTREDMNAIARIIHKKLAETIGLTTP